MIGEKKTFLIALGLWIFLLSISSLHAEPMRVRENLSGDQVLLPPSAPEAGQLTLVSFVTIAPGAVILAAMAAYDDPRTGRPIDYLELYNGAGSLIVIRWTDRFGIRRTAVDRGLLREEPSGPEGILVLLIEGTPI